MARAREEGAALAPPPRPRFLGSPAGRVLIVALVVGGLLLGYERGALVFGGGGLIWLALLGCVGMHVFMHGGHGGRGSGGRGSGGGGS